MAWAFRWSWQLQCGARLPSQCRRGPCGASQLLPPLLLGPLRHCCRAALSFLLAQDGALSFEPAHPLQAECDAPASGGAKESAETSSRSLCVSLARPPPCRRQLPGAAAGPLLPVQGAVHWPRQGPAVLCLLPWEQDPQRVRLSGSCCSTRG